MKIRLLIATNDEQYAQRLWASGTPQNDIVEISVCTDYAHLNTMLSSNKYEVLLLEQDAIPYVRTSSAQLQILLWDQTQSAVTGVPDTIYIKKYQRISLILSQVITHYAQVAPEQMGLDKSSRITAVWSPAGGVGKTSVALAFAAHHAAAHKKVTYLDLEAFSGIPVLFSQPGNSLTTVFEQLGGNMALQLRGLLTTDSTTGIGFWGAPNNYDDLNALSRDELTDLIRAASHEIDELVIDLSSVCSEKIWDTFDLADQILLVVDQSPVAQAKLQQFVSQNDIYHRFLHKMTLVVNKGARFTLSRDIKTIPLPVVNSGNPVTVYQKLAATRF